MDTIEIPSPCHEPWESMTPAAQGRHCGSCDRVVVDLSVMTRAEAMRVLASDDEHLCINVLVDGEGRARFRQEIPSRRRLPVLTTRALLAAAAIAALSACGPTELATEEPPCSVIAPTPSGAESVVQPVVIVTPVVQSVQPGQSAQNTQPVQIQQQIVPVVPVHDTTYDTIRGRRRLIR